MKKDNKKTKYLIISIISVCAGIFIWWLVTDGLGLFRSNVLPSPVKVVRTFIRKMYQPKWTDTLTMFSHNKKISKSGQRCYISSIRTGIMPTIQSL